MSKWRTSPAIVASLMLVALLPSAQAMAVVCPAEAPGQMVTYQGPEPVPLEYVENMTYYYDWSAEANGSTIASGSDRNFSFTTPDVTPEEGIKIVTVTLLVSDTYSCTNQATDCLSIHAPPGCGIDGPIGICEDSPYGEFSYVGEDTTSADFTFAWTLDETPVGTGETTNFSWSSFDYGDHVLTLDVEKTYPDGTVVNTTCEQDVKYVESPSATFFLAR